MEKKYVYILITFIAIQLSVFIGMPLLYFTGVTLFNVEPAKMEVLATGIWIVFSFTAGLLIVLLLLRKKDAYTNVERSAPMPLGPAMIWAVGGIFIAFFAQIAAVLVERALGIEPGSENTQQIMNLIKLFPLVMVASSIIGPILEEIVFRKVIFGTLYNRLPFWAAALISSLAFSLAHMEPKHLILYAAMGFTFAFLYVKTKRIIVPIISHMMMNTLVTVVQFTNREKIEEMTAYVQGWIGGFF
ncbi:CPBP family intramembrane glutamic endopeptidase [Lederbergia citrea]|uniref:CPBP family intramembrane metalloprotease n=1 Tax=Lederbergia citrea TaxID=2833581 RepID=A0A942UU63_9BACI|nr:CPBP family intramembrane glutamic endopeptidase [Lederbergia citrea]MBS4179600.1 CPBP family intramembrane metalloprotease [Lederbergia citrea]MBS4206267.1 CPBP family intramembrane metalloprotease [Lederbergia citrea]MBS4224798.1 CPBP family intramembrane metalloprotease [Lederbergia citrea]